MEKFKVGDLVKRIGDSRTNIVHGEVYEVTHIDLALGELSVRGVIGNWAIRKFQLYKPKSKYKNKHQW